jgi:hypothetical protein
MSTRPFFILSLILLCWLPAGLLEAGKVPPAQWQRELRATAAALEQARREYTRQKAQRVLTRAEERDYENYLSRLRERLAEYCGRMAEAGEVPPEIAPVCNDAAPSQAAPEVFDPRREYTNRERTADLEAELDAVVGEFDEMLLREQELLDRRQLKKDGGMSGGGGSGPGEQGAAGKEDTDEQADAGSSAGGGEGEQGDAGSSAGGGEAAGGQGTGEAAASTGGGAGDGQAGGRRGQGGEPSGPGGGGTGGAGTAGDIPDGSDDDIVARQLREAAEKETDPELKKKLWEEYRRYKNGR